MSGFDGGYRRPAGWAVLAAATVASMGFGSSVMAVEERRREERKADLLLTGGKFRRRSRGKQAKPKKRRNMVRLSRRVRRKHRRAA